MRRSLKIHPSDNTIVALESIESGELTVVDGQPVRVLDAVPFGHKIALSDMQPGEPVIKYGACIGIASQLIRVGEHVHSHNLTSVRGSVER